MRTVDATRKEGLIYRTQVHLLLGEIQKLEAKSKEMEKSLAELDEKFKEVENNARFLEGANRLLDERRVKAENKVKELTKEIAQMEAGA